MTGDICVSAIHSFLSIFPLAIFVPLDRRSFPSSLPSTRLVALAVPILASPLHTRCKSSELCSPAPPASPSGSTQSPAGEQQSEERGDLLRASNYAVGPAREAALLSTVLLWCNRRGSLRCLTQPHKRWHQKTLGLESDSQELVEPHPWSCLHLGATDKRMPSTLARVSGPKKYSHVQYFVARALETGSSKLWVGPTSTTPRKPCHAVLPPARRG